MLDLGLSPYQLKLEDGFSYQGRPNLNQADKGIQGGMKAKDVLNTYSDRDIIKAL